MKGGVNVEQTLKERIQDLIRTEREVNAQHEQDNLTGFKGDIFMPVFINGKEAVLKQLEKLLQDSP